MPGESAHTHPGVEGAVAYHAGHPGFPLQVAKEPINVLLENLVIKKKVSELSH